MQIIGGKYKKKKLFSPKTENVRPSSSKLRGALFNICQNEIEDARFLDLFAGSGAMGLEALSRKAKHATFVEKDRQTILLLKKNIAFLKEEKNASICPMDCFAALEKFSREKQTFDLIFADPPYVQKGPSLSNKILRVIDRSSLLSEGGFLFLEDDAKAEKEDIELTHLHLVSVRKMGRSLLRQYYWTSGTFSGVVSREI